MIVTRTTFTDVIEQLRNERRLGLDTETTGLRMYHEDRLFSVILATPKEAFYFNFKDYPEEKIISTSYNECVLGIDHLLGVSLALFLDETKIWYIQNAANFDLPVLKVSGFELAGKVHCTKAIGRVVYNDYQEYSLAKQLERIGLEKDMSVDAYIKENKLFTVLEIPGKKQSVKLLHFDKVPFSMISKYGEKDGTGVINLGLFQEKRIEELALERPDDSRSVLAVMENECRLQKTIFRMKHVGVQIDKGFCEKAARWEEERSRVAAGDFQNITGREYKSSPKLFEEVFQELKSKWGKTKKGNPSFDADALAKLDHPAAKAILTLRDAKSKADFYWGFLYHADRDGVIHPNYNPEGTVHGRFSSSEPNFQNLTAEDNDGELAQEFVVRRAIIPRSGYILIMPDYDQMEYKFALEMACRVSGKLSPLAQSVRDGFDFHDATKARVKEVTGQDYPRKTMKIANFLTLYGGGVGKLAGALGVSMAEARTIRSAIKSAAPEIENYIQTIMRVAEERKYIVNWLGRRCYFPYRSYAYRAPNYHVSGGCADCVKIAMNQIDEYLLNKKSRLLVTIHDELVLEIHESEIEEVPLQVKYFMENVFISKYVPLTVGMKWAKKSLADKIAGFPS